MTKKDFIRLLIKLMGILVLLNSLPLFIGQFAFYSRAEGWNMILYMALVLILTIAFSVWLIFYPDSIIKFFKLDKGFDDDQIKLDQLKSEKLISIAVLVIGGMFILNSLAPLLVEIGQKIYASVAEGQSIFPTFEESDNTRLYTNIIELCLGCFLITNYQKMTHLLASKNKEEE
ncbi:hypothetical protein CLV62_101407 [Dysgonomonas alginatilytica]|uniref:Uncharacterized protein n=1 Tax=Dysgonomonas alginatilytica TaxID=1605892 RepID=A0A2V3PX27_9BACT|nr:hypothetical protein [Dysgonomonas alginatilytica]PXV69138.1 hypothetical protein CLV62_101407 [Dysgonomonas alginatilytica]